MIKQIRTTLHIFAENEPARLHNQTMLEIIDHSVLTIEAIDQVPDSVPNHLYDRILNMSGKQIGTILRIHYKNEKVETSIIKFDDSKAGLKRKQSQLGRYYDAVPIERVTLDIKTNAKKDSSPTIKRTQFPLTLSWGCTVHKVQGIG